MNNIIKILWTGGFDSTFRVCELSRMENTTVQPVYVIDSNRKSVEFEKKSMENIIAALKSKRETKAVILDPIMYKLQDIPADEEISRAYQIIHEKTHLGSQHEWLAWLGKLHPGMEMGTEAGTAETSHIINAIEQFGTLDFEGNIGYLNPEKSSAEGMLVLGWFRFPIITRYETDMLAKIKEWGYEDVIKHIWFCHSPIDGQPCGLCHPCDVKMESDMEWLLPKAARKRYRLHKKMNKVLCGHLTGVQYRILKTLK